MRTDLYRVKCTSEGRDACGLAWLRAAILLSRFHITRGSGGSLVGRRDECLGFTMARAYDSVTFRAERPCAITSQGGERRASRPLAFRYRGSDGECSSL